MTRDDRGLRALAGSVADALAPLFARRDIMEVRLLSEWQGIVGAGTAALCRPEKLAFPPRRRQHATLHLSAMSRAGSLELQYAAPQIIGRINSYFGYPLVAKVRLLPATGKPPVSPPSPEGSPAVAKNPSATGPQPAALALIEDPEMRDLLAAFGRRAGETETQ